MFDSDVFKELVNNTYLINNRNQFMAALMDCFPDERLLRNLIIYCFDLGIADELNEKNPDIFTYNKYINRIMENHGVSKDLAAWSVNEWFQAYGYIINESTESNDLTREKIKQRYFAQDNHIYCTKNALITTKRIHYRGFSINFLTESMGFHDPVEVGEMSKGFVYGSLGLPIRKYIREGKTVSVNDGGILIEFSNDQDAIEFVIVLDVYFDHDYLFELPWQQYEWSDSSDVYDKNYIIDKFLSDLFIKPLKCSAHIITVEEQRAKIVKEDYGIKTMLCNILYNDDGNIYSPDDGRNVNWEDIHKNGSSNVPIFFVIYSEDKTIFRSWRIGNIGTDLHIKDFGKKLYIGSYDDYFLMQFDRNAIEGRRVFDYIFTAQDFFSYMDYKYKR